MSTAALGSAIKYSRVIVSRPGQMTQAITSFQKIAKDDRVKQVAKPPSMFINDVSGKLVGKEADPAGTLL